MATITPYNVIQVPAQQVASWVSPIPQAPYGYFTVNVPVTPTPIVVASPGAGFTFG